MFNLSFGTGDTVAGTYSIGISVAATWPRKHPCRYWDISSSNLAQGTPLQVLGYQYQQHGTGDTLEGIGISVAAT